MIHLTQVVFRKSLPNTISTTHNRRLRFVLKSVLIKDTIRYLSKQAVFYTAGSSDWYRYRTIKYTSQRRRRADTVVVFAELRLPLIWLRADHAPLVENRRNGSQDPWHVRNAKFVNLRGSVSCDGRIADTSNALTLREAAYPPVQYIPGEDVDFSQLERTDHATYCPYKGDCYYYRIPAGGKKSVNAVWSYEDPFPAVAQIRGHVAFYPERADEIAEQLPG